MGGHALRGAVTAWLALITLQAASSKANTGRLGSLFADLDTLVQRALDPSVPAIPDRRTTGSADAGSPYYVPDPGAVARGAVTAGQLLAPGTQTAISNGLPGQVAALTPDQITGLSGLGQYSPAQLAQAWGLG